MGQTVVEIKEERVVIAPGRSVETKKRVGGGLGLR